MKVIFNRMKLNKLIFLILLLIIISLPRFNWRPLPEPLNKFVGGKPFDVEQYEKYVEYFRGNTNLVSELEGPFSYRPMVPFLASYLPFDALTSINIINLIFLVIGLVYLKRFLIYLEFEEKWVLLGQILFIVSFPHFYYSTSGYIDASVLGILSITMYYLFLNKYFHFLLSFLIGIFIKETVMIILPVAVVYFLLRDSVKNKILKISIPLFLYISTIIIIRISVPQKENYIWNPSFEIFMSNLGRVKTYLTFIFTFGIPGILSLLLIFSGVRKKISRNLLFPLITGFVFSILLWIYSLFAAYSDGRQIWTSYIFTIPLSLLFIEKKFNNSSKSWTDEN